MKSNRLEKVKVAILLTDGFEESEMTSPRKALEDEGADVSLISLHSDKVRSWQHNKWGKYFKVADKLANVKVSDFDALVLPGGVMNPDSLRADKAAIKFVTQFMNKAKPVAAICHGPWTLIETGLIKGKSLTSYHSIKTDLVNAGANWVNKKVVCDDNLITSRSPDDLPAFNSAIIKLLSRVS